MPDLAEQIRAIVDSTAPPIAVDEVTRRPGTPGRRRNVALVAAGVVLIALVTVAVIVARDDHRRSNVRVTTPSPGSAPPGWTRLPDSPLGSRAGHVMAWTGSELLVWGGGGERGVQSDGAAYDPATRQWTSLPDSPLHPSSAQLLGVWTGNEFLVWDNASDGAHRDGAAYNPATGTWRSIAASPLPADQYQPVIVWAGDQALLWSAAVPTGSADPVRTFFASYDPNADRWRTLDPGPLDVNGAAGAWDGHELLLTGWLTNHPNGVFPIGGSDPSAAFDPTTGTWRTISSPDKSLQQPLTVAWDGRELVTVTYNLEWSAYDPSTDQWDPIASVPLQAGECGPDSAATSTSVFLYYCGAGAVFDNRTRAWEPVATPFEPHGRATPLTAFPPSTPLVATGSGYVVFGAGGAEPNPDVWSYTPTITPGPASTTTTVPPPAGVDLGPLLDPNALPNLPETGIAITLGATNTTVLVDTSGHVIGHLTGYTLSADPPTAHSPWLLLQHDDAITVRSADGTPHWQTSPPGAIPLAGGASLTKPTATSPGTLHTTDGHNVQVAPGAIDVSADRRYVTSRQLAGSTYVHAIVYNTNDGTTDNYNEDCFVGDATTDTQALVCHDAIRLRQRGRTRTIATTPPGQGGIWLAARLAPDGAAVLGQFSGECETPSAWFVPTNGGPPRLAGPPTTPYESGGLGWLSPNEAIISFGPEVCGAALPNGPGVYTVTLDGTVHRLYATGDNIYGAELWTTLHPS